jgi:hypothetical protein
VATVAIKGTSSSSKYLFPMLNKWKSTCLMAKESKHNVKTKGLSSPKYVSSDDDDDSDDGAPFPIGINEKGIIKKLGKELVAWDQLPEDQEDLLEQQRKGTCELKKHLNLGMEKNEELPKARILSPVSRAQLVLSKTRMMSCKRRIKILKCNLMLFGQEL